MGGRHGGMRISFGSRHKQDLGSRSIHRRNDVSDCGCHRAMLCWRRVPGTFCSLERILQDNADAKSILEARFGPLQEKHHRAADALRLTRGMTKPALVIHGTQDRTVPMLHGRKLTESIGAAAEFVPIDGGEHHLRNVDRRGLIERIVAWLLAQDRIFQ